MLVKKNKENCSNHNLVVISLTPSMKVNHNGSKSILKPMFNLDNRLMIVFIKLSVIESIRYLFPSPKAKSIIVNEDEYSLSDVMF